MIYSDAMISILKIVKKYLNKQVIFAEQDKIRPKDDYVIMHYIGQNPIGRGGKFINENEVMRFSQKYDLEVCFDCIGKNPYEIALKIASMWKLTGIQEQLNQMNISWHKNFSIRNTSDVFDEKYLARVSFEAFFYVENLTYEQQYIIEKVKINGVN